MNPLVEIDRSVFYLINSRFQNPVFDFLMPLITDVKQWKIPVVFLLWVGLGLRFVFPLLKGGTLDDGAEDLARTLKRGTVVLLMLAIGVGAGDAATHRLLKPLFGRIRPCAVLHGVNLLASCNHSFSLPSGHAVNSVALAVILGSMYPRLTPVVVLLAFLVCYSRVYVGVHYPLDVVAGALVGYAFGKSAVYLVERISRRSGPGTDGSSDRRASGSRSGSTAC